MRYEAYRKQLTRAAGVLLESDGVAADVVNLAGGYFGLSFPVDGAGVILTIDLDGAEAGGPEWIAWREDRDGERCCDHGAELVGVFRPRDYSGLYSAALGTLTGHRCRCWKCGKFGSFVGHGH